MSELSARILEEEFPIKDERCREDIGKQETTVGEDVCRIRSPNDDLERDEKLELAHEGETNGQHDRNRDKDRIRNHENFPYRF